MIDWLFLYNGSLLLWIRSQNDLSALLTIRQYPSTKSAILSAAFTPLHVIVKSSEFPRTLILSRVFISLQLQWFISPSHCFLLSLTLFEPLPFVWFWFWDFGFCRKVEILSISWKSVTRIGSACGCVIYDSPVWKNEMISYKMFKKNRYLNASCKIIKTE